jgi:multidrug efflux system membrane fusion protein
MKRVVKVVVPIAIVVVAVALAVMLVKNRPRAERQAPAVTVPTVVVVNALRSTFAPKIRSTGIVRAARDVVIAPEIGGRVVWVAPQLVPGGRVKKGETLVRIDERDLVLLVEEAKARVAQADLALTLEKSQGERARRELAMIGDSKLAGGSLALALREPQLKNAEAQREGAGHALARAELNLTRATIRAPMDAIVQTERAEVGQLATPQTVLATLLGVDVGWVVASIPVDRLRFMQIGEGERGATAEVTQILGDGRDASRTARVVRLLGELEAETRTAQVVLEISKPFDPVVGGLPVLPGAFVEVDIAGLPLEGVFAIPRIALVDDANIWVVDGEDRLRRKPVDIVWRDKAFIVVKEGVDDGDRVVTTPIPTAVEGTLVKVVIGSSPSDATPGETR